MRKKILIIGSICLVLVLGIAIVVKRCIIVVEKPKGEKGVVVFSSEELLNITALPTKIANAIIPPPKLERKSPEERKRIIRKYLQEMNEAYKYWQILKGIEISERILKMGDIIVPVLIEIFRDASKDGTMRYWAVKMLDEILRYKNTPLDELMDEDWKREMYGELYELANKIDIESAVPVLIEIAYNKNEERKSRGFAVGLLGKLKDKRAVEPLIKLVEEEGLGISDLGEIGDERAVEVLIKVMETDKGVVYPKYVMSDREAAITALGKIGGKKSIKVLMALFKENPKDKVVIEALGTAKTEEAVPMLIEMLEKEKGYNWSVIVETLGNIGNDQSIDGLINSYKQRGGGG